MSEPNNPDLQRQIDEELAALRSTNVPIEPIQPIINTPNPSNEPSSIKPKKNGLKMALALAGVACISVAAIAAIKSNATKKTLSNSTNPRASKTELLSGSQDKKYRLYEKSTDDGRGTNVITLTDTTGKVITTQNSKYPLHLMATIDNHYFILKEDDYNGHYWLLDNAGKFGPINPEVDRVLLKDAGSQNAITALSPISSQEVLYYQCDTDISQYCGILHRLNILNGSAMTYKVKTGGELWGVSQNGSTAYLLGFDLSLVYFDLIEQKVVKEVKLPKLSKGIRQLWVSPNGAYLASADEATNIINAYSTGSGKTIQVQAPKSWLLNSWTGEVTLPSPKWSPDEKSVAFVAWNNSAQYMAIVDFSKSSYLLVDQIDTSKDASENEGGPGLNHHKYKFIGWESATGLDYNAENAENIGGIGNVVGNYNYVLGGKPIVLKASYGNLMDTNETRSALQ